MPHDPHPALLGPAVVALLALYAVAVALVAMWAGWLAPHVARLLRLVGRAAARAVALLMPPAKPRRGRL